MPDPDDLQASIDRTRADLAATLTEVVSDPERARAYGRAGRERAASAFSWEAIADETAALYREVVAAAREGSGAR